MAARALGPAGAGLEGGQRLLGAAPAFRGLASMSLEALAARLASDRAGLQRDSAFGHAGDYEHEATGPAADVVAAVASGPLGGDSEKPKETDKEKDEETLQKEREDELAAIERARQEAIARGKEALKDAELARATLRTGMAQLREFRQRISELEREYKLRNKALQMLPESEKHLAELHAAGDADEERLLQLAAQWEVHRRPLVEAVRELKAARAARKKRAAELEDKATGLSEEMLDMAREVREKKAQRDRLKEEFQAMPKADHTRSGYTEQLIDIMQRIQQQEKEIARKVGEVQSVKGEISRVQVVLERTSSRANDQMYRAVAQSGNEKSHVDAYRQFTRIRETF